MKNYLEMHPIDIEKCPKNHPAKIYYPDGTLIVETDDERIFNYVRAEIKEHELVGCYIEYKGQRIRIDYKGNLENYPDKEFFEANTEQLFRLI